MILIQPDIVTIAPCSHRKLDLFVCGDHSGCNARGRADVVARPSPKASAFTKRNGAGLLSITPVATV